MDFIVMAKMIFDPHEEECAGLVILQNDGNQIRYGIHKNDLGVKEAVCMTTKTIVENGKQYFKEKAEGVTIVSDNSVFLSIEGKGTKYSFRISEDGVSWQSTVENVDGSFLGSETSGGFIGAYIGMFAYCNIEDRERYAAFDSFCYKAMECFKG